jgi:hypothetical protein
MPVCEPPDVLEADVAGDLVDQHAVHRVGQERRLLGTGRRSGEQSRGKREKQNASHDALREWKKTAEVGGL